MTWTHPTAEFEYGRRYAAFGDVLRRLWPEVESSLGLDDVDALRQLVDDEVLTQSEAEDVAFQLGFDQ